MTISAVVPDIAFAGSSSPGTMGPFSLVKSGTPLVFYANSEVVVLRYASVTDTAPTLLVEGTHYTLTGGPTAGSITLISPSTGLLTAERLYVTTLSALAQSLDLVNGGNFSSSNLERRLDVIFQILQQHAREIKSTIRFAMFDTDEIPKTTPLGAVIDKIPFVTGTAENPVIDFIDQANLIADIAVVADSLEDIGIVAADLSGADTIGIVAAGMDDIEDVSGALPTLTPALPDIATVATAIDNGTIGDLLDGQIAKADTYAALTAVVEANRSNGMVMYVASRAAAGDGGEGYWRFDAGSSATANGGTILAPDAGTGRWIRQVTGVVYSSWFTADGTGFAAAIAAAISANVPLDLGGKTITFGTSGVITSLVEGQKLIVRNGTINGSAVTASQVLGSGVTASFVWGVVAKDGSGRDMWDASYAKATLTSSAARGATSIAVDQTSSLAPGDWVLIHDTTKVWDTDGSVQSEAHLVLSRSASSGAGTITLAGFLDHDYTTSATVRRFVNAELSTENLTVLGVGSTGTQDGITTLGLLRRRSSQDVIDGCHRRSFSDYNALEVTFHHSVARNCYESGFGYGFIGNGSVLHSTDNCKGENLRIIHTAGKGPSSSQMTRLQRAHALSGQGLTENVIDAHPGVYRAQWSQLSGDFQNDADPSGDAIVFSGTHLSLDGLELGQCQRSGVTVYRYGHLLPSNDGARIYIANVNIQPNAADTIQYGFFYDDVNAGSNKQDQSVIIRDCDFTSQSGCYIKNRLVTIENLQISGSRMVSVSSTNTIAGRGLTMDSLTAGGVANFRSSNNVYGANSSALSLDAALIARRSGASIAAQSYGDRMVGAGRHGFVIEYGVLKHIGHEMPGSGYTGSAISAGTSGTITAL